MRKITALIIVFIVGGCATTTPSSPPPNSAADAMKTGIAELASGISPKVVTARKTSVAIIGFSPVMGDKKKSDVFSQYLVEELTTKLVNDNRVTVAERSHLDKIMKELKLQSSGKVSDASAKQLGHLLGVDAVLVGSYMDQGDSVRVNERIIATESGKVLAATSSTFRKTKLIARLLGQPGAGSDEPPAQAKKSTPIYKKWWFWTIVGGVVVGGAAGAVAATTGGDGWVASGANGRFDPTTFPSK